MAKPLDPAPLRSDAPFRITPHPPSSNERIQDSWCGSSRLNKKRTTALRLKPLCLVIEEFTMFSRPIMGRKRNAFPPAKNTLAPVSRQSDKECVCRVTEDFLRRDGRRVTRRRQRNFGTDAVNHMAKWGTASFVSLLRVCTHCDGAFCTKSPKVSTR